MTNIEAPRLTPAPPVPPACVMDFCDAWANPFVWPEEQEEALSVREWNDTKAFWLGRV